GQERDQRQVVADPDDVAVAPRIEEVGDGGDDERAPGETTEEEVNVDQERPVGRLYVLHALSPPRPGRGAGGRRRGPPRRPAGPTRSTAASPRGCSAGAPGGCPASRTWTASTGAGRTRSGRRG